MSFICPYLVASICVPSPFPWPQAPTQVTAASLSELYGRSVQIQVKSVHEYYNTKHYQQHKSVYYAAYRQQQLPIYLLENCMKNGEAEPPVCLSEEAGYRLHFKIFGNGVQLQVFVIVGVISVFDEPTFCN